MLLDMDGQFASHVQISIMWSSEDITGLCIVGGFVAKQNRQKDSSTTVVVKVGGENA